MGQHMQDFRTPAPHLENILRTGNTQKHPQATKTKDLQRKRRCHGTTVKAKGRDRVYGIQENPDTIDNLFREMETRITPAIVKPVKF